MSYDRLILRKYAIERMFERGIRETDVRRVVADGEVIQTYPEDTPYPSRLMLGWVGDRPLHVVAADADDVGATLVFKNVPARVCETCGEAYVEDEVAGELLEEAERAVQTGVQVDVRQYVTA